jgi:hypothetical protein
MSTLYYSRDLNVSLSGTLVSEKEAGESEGAVLELASGTDTVQIVSSSFAPPPARYRCLEVDMIRSRNSSFWPATSIRTNECLYTLLETSTASHDLDQTRVANAEVDQHWRSSLHPRYPTLAIRLNPGRRISRRRHGS